MSISSILFLLLFFGGIYLAFARHPIWGLGSYLMALYGAPSHNWYGKELPDLRWSLLASLCVFLSIFFNSKRLMPKTPWYSHTPGVLIACYAMWMWIQLTWALAPSIHVEASILMTKYIVLFYIIYRILSTDTDYFLFVIFNIAGAFYVSKRVLAYSLGGRVEGIGGPGLNDANSLGMHLCVILIFSSMMLLKKNTIFKNTLYWKICQAGILIATAYIANAAIQCISRSAVLGLVGGGLLLVVIKHKAVKKKFYFLAAMAFIGILYFAPPTFWGRLGTITGAVQGEEVESSAYSRLVIGLAQLEMFKENILGHGHRGTIVLSPFYIPEEYLTNVGGGMGRASHCTFLTTLAEQGIPGAVMYIIMVLWAMRTIMTYRKNNPNIYLYFMAASASLVVIFISGIFVDYLKAEIQIYCFAIIASLEDYQIRKQYEINQNLNL